LQGEPIQGEVTRLLREVKSGDTAASSKLIVLVYDELRRLGAHYMRQERGNHTLQATALVHEAYMRLVDKDSLELHNREHFFAVAAQAMRHILVDHARAHKAGKRGGAKQQVELNEALGVTNENPEEMIALDQALTRLAEFDARKARVVELIYFGGLTKEEVASVLDVAVETIYRDWKHARAWLHKELGQQTP
jgi:RNA polymerase sigma factor (TIGR02999 family)